jgi:hypothetical protein
MHDAATPWLGRCIICTADLVLVLKRHRRSRSCAGNVAKTFLPLSRLWLAKSCAEKILVNEILKRWVSTEIASFAMISSIVAS